MTKLQRAVVIAFSILVCGGLLVASSQAQLPATNADAVKNPVSDHTETVAYQNGYQDGWVEGESQWARSGGPNLNGSGNYKKADHGYSESLGDRNSYKDLYRRGFVDGYSRGYGITFAQKEKRHE